MELYLPLNLVIPLLQIMVVLVLLFPLVRLARDVPLLVK
jgi:hypothetical protein